MNTVIAAALSVADHAAIKCHCVRCSLHVVHFFKIELLLL